MKKTNHEKNPSELEIKLKKYLELTSKALEKVKIPQSLSQQAKKSAEDLLDLSQRYFDDAKYFGKKGSLIDAFGAIVYSHAFLDVGARLGLFDVGGDNKLFMVD